MFAQPGHEMSVELFVWHVFASKAILVSAGDDSHPRRGTDGRGHIGACEADPVGAKAVDIGRLDGMVAIGGQVAVAQIVGDDQDDVWWWRWFLNRCLVLGEGPGYAANQ